MSASGFLGRLLGAFALLLLLAEPALADDDLSIGRMRLSIWPEHDDPGVLVVYDGRFVDDSAFPTTATFLIPKGAVINDICSLSPGGQHFCQLYDVVDGGEVDKAVISLPFSNFYVSFHLPLLDPAVEQRQFEYRLKINHQTKNLEVDIEQPLRATDFTISPPGGERGEDDGFTRFGYTLENLSKGDERVFRIAYKKADGQPSVDTKYAGMSGPRVWGSPYDTQRRIKGIIYAVFASGVAVLLAGLFWLLYWRRRRTVQNA
ncbi:MAG: hypothetical protein QF491_11835 [Alphaproteobacteria bacterium]|jgi:hypothetical protein|nr:hypothetical protein [Alphaproteobacteria bacterium]